MKVLISTDNLGDSYNCSLDLAEKLENHGIEVILAVTGQIITKKQKKELQPFHHYFAEFKPEWMENSWNDIGEAGKWLMKIHRQVGPDLVHLNSFSMGNLSWNVPVINAIHHCPISRCRAVYSKPTMRWNKYRQMAQQALRNANVVVAPSRTMLSATEKLYGPFKSSRVIANGKDSYNYKSDVKEKYVFSAGRLWDEAKNLSLILKAAPKINYPIYLACERHKIRHKKIPQNVFFTEELRQDQLIDWLANAFIFLLPSKYEPFGYPFVEAAFSKCTLIGGDIPSLREVWQDAMFYVDDAESLAETVNGLMENKEIMYLYGQKAYERAHENYTVEKMVRHYHELYEHAVELEPLRQKMPIRRKDYFQDVVKRSMSAENKLMTLLSNTFCKYFKK